MYRGINRSNAALVVVEMCIQIEKYCVVNGSILIQPALHVNVATEGERGMLGIAIAKHTRANGTTDRFVFLYYTQSNSTMPLDGRLCLFRNNFRENRTPMRC
jgi:hypothetical protein